VQESSRLESEVEQRVGRNDSRHEQQNEAKTSREGVGRGGNRIKQTRLKGRKNY